MTDKQQIEEMAGCEKCYKVNGKCYVKTRTYCTDWRRANHFYNAGYRRVPENAVVLTRERYDELIEDLENTLAELMEVDLQRINARKEMEEIFTKLIEVAKNNDNKLSIGLLKAWAIEYEVEVET